MSIGRVVEGILRELEANGSSKILGFLEEMIEWGEKGQQWSRRKKAEKFREYAAKGMTWEEIKEISGLSDEGICKVYTYLKDKDAGTYRMLRHQAMINLIAGRLLRGERLTFLQLREEGQVMAEAGRAGEAELSFNRLKGKLKNFLYDDFTKEGRRLNEISQALGCSSREGARHYLLETGQYGKWKEARIKNGY